MDEPGNGSAPASPCQRSIRERESIRWLSEHGDALFIAAQKRMRDAHAAEDVVQDTLLDAARSEPPLDRDTERAWLLAIVRNKAIDWIRKQARERRGNEQLRQLSEDPFDARGRWLTSPRAWSDPAHAMERAEFWATLERLLDELPASMARAFVLREIDQVSVPDICELLDISRENCWTLLHRARGHLRARLEKEWFAKRR